MARPFPYLETNHLQSSLPLTIGIFFSIFALLALCARHSSKSRKSSKRHNNVIDDIYEQESVITTTTTTTTATVYKTPPRSPLASPRKFLSNISNIKVNNNNNKGNMNKIQEDDVMVLDHQNEGFGEGGLWQKDILMGEKCQPLEFSGVIYYDSYGNVTSQPPRSPRMSSAASLQGSISFPVSTRTSTDHNNY